MFKIHGSPSLSGEDTFQDPQWMPKHEQHPNPIYTMFFLPKIKFLGRKKVQ